MSSLNSFNSETELLQNASTYRIYSIAAFEEHSKIDVRLLPRTLKILLENLLRHEDDNTVTKDHILSFKDWLENRTSDREIAFRPGRVLMQDFTGVPAVADLAAMRDAFAEKGGNPDAINPLIPVDLIIDHSVQVDSYSSPDSYRINVEKEMERNRERYVFLRWGQNSLKNFKVVPPGTGICHQVNLEYLARVVWQGEDANGVLLAYPDTLLGTDSHTTMINGLGILGWGVGGIEAEAAILGQPVSMTIPEVVGVRLTGTLQAGVTATDLVLTVTELLRKTGVVGKFVEFFGHGLNYLSIADRATIANMSPEYGATCGFFPVDSETIRYLNSTGRGSVAELVEKYAKLQGLWHDSSSPEPVFTKVVEFNLAAVVPCLAGPKRPQDRVMLNNLPAAVSENLPDKTLRKHGHIPSLGAKLSDGDLVIAAITSCTNTSNPSVMIAAALLAKNALSKGLKSKPWVKTSLAPGSKVVMEYLRKFQLYEPLVTLGFELVGYGCTTCIGNSGPLKQEIESVITDNNLTVAAILSGNRNFEGRIHPLAQMSWLASPPLVVAFAIAGTTNIDITTEPLGVSNDGTPVFLSDIMPTNDEVNELVGQITPAMFNAGYGDLYDGTASWQSLVESSSSTYNWDDNSSYIKQPPFMKLTDKADLFAKPMSILAIFGDSITTDHISPAGSIPAASPAGLYLQHNGVAVKDFNSYGSRRGNHEVMRRGTFANIRIKNEMTPHRQGGFTVYQPDGVEMTIFDAAERYQAQAVPLVVIAGREYGSGSSRDWAAKGPLLIGVRVVIAESYERIHRSNLIGMGILPLQFLSGESRKTLQLDGSETISLEGCEAELEPCMEMVVNIKRKDGTKQSFRTRSRIDTMNEVYYFKAGGILKYMLNTLDVKA